METRIAIDHRACNACGMCAEVCPIQLMRGHGDQAPDFRRDRLPFCMKCGQCMAVCPSKAIVVEGLAYDHDFFPLPRGEVEHLSFIEMISTRRAIRVFKDQPLPRQMLDQIVRAIALAPPGFTPLKTEIVVVQDTAVIRQALPAMINVYEHLVAAMDHPIARHFIRRKVGHAKFRTLERHVVPLMRNRLPELKRGEEDTITRNAPAMIIFHADREAENYESDIFIAMTYAFLAAHALGLGATAIDLIPPAIQNDSALRRLFSIPDGNVVVAAVILGYAKYRYQRGITRELKRVTWI